MFLSRRGFLVGAGVIALGFGGLRMMLSHRRGDISSTNPLVIPGFGPLQRDPQDLLDLPAGFRYVVFSRTGEKMDDGLLVPGKHDGMAAFAHASGKTLLIRNHELNPDDAKVGPFGRRNELLGSIDTGRLYDAGRGVAPCVGGTTTLLFDTRAGRLERHHLSLSGTLRNCAGGPTPWGSWLTCEETVARADGEREHDHGYVFEVPADLDAGLVPAVALTAMGRFNHEAVAVDPASGVVYLTEDRSDGLLYRLIPNTPGKLIDGGRLQALIVIERPKLDTRNWEEQTVEVGAALACAWIDVHDIDAPEDDLRYRGFEDGAARFARGEGVWYGSGAVYFACTNGGAAKFGQIFRYTPSPQEGTAGEIEQPGRLELFIEPNDRTVVENADNITFAPWGDLIICEDGKDDQCLVGVTPQGQLYKLARNARNESEFAGACFSPDGSTLFVNIQTPGLTLAITGPWRSQA